MVLTQKTKNKCLCWLFFGVFFGLLSGTTLYAETKEEASTPPEIHVSADRLVSDRNNNYAEFIGNVVVEREDATLTCNKLKIFYAEKKKDSSKDNKAGAIDKIIATENVYLKFDDKTAVSEKAVYIAKNDSITLTGGSPKVTSGNSYISGDKITLFRTDGKVIVDSGENKRVSATFHPEDEELIKKKKKQ